VYFDKILEKQNKLEATLERLQEQVSGIERSIHLLGNNMASHCHGNPVGIAARTQGNPVIIGHWQGSPVSQGNPDMASHWQGSPVSQGNPEMASHWQGSPGGNTESTFAAAFPQLKKLEWSGIVSSWHKYGLSKFVQFPKSDNFKALSRMYVYSLHFLFFPRKNFLFPRLLKMFVN
jgi:hypothetical protein